jgi:hypothetical protein
VPPPDRPGFGPLHRAISVPVVDLTSLVVGALLGAVFGFFADRMLPPVWRSITRPKELEAHVEVDQTIRFELDPAVFEADLPNWIGAAYMLPDRDIAEFGPPASEFCREWREWARAQRGVDARATNVQVTVERLGENTVVIDGLEVNVWKRTPAVEGTLVECLVGGAAIQPRELGVRLDDERPQAAYFREPGTRVGPARTSCSSSREARSRRTNSSSWLADRARLRAPPDDATSAKGGQFSTGTDEEYSDGAHSPRGGNRSWLEPGAVVGTSSPGARGLRLLQRAA